MRRTRALIATALTAVLAAGLTACGGESKDSGEIDVWIGFVDHRLDWMKDRAKEFEKEHDGYKVNITGYKDYPTLWDKLTAAAKQGEPPTIAQNFEAATQESRDAVNDDGEPLFASVEKEIDGRDEILGEKVVLDDIIDATRNYYTIDGEFASMPWNTSTPVFYANKDFLKKAKIKKTPETWEDLQAACDKIDKMADGPKNCITWPNQAWFLEQPLAEQGGLLVNKDNGRSGRATEIDLTSDKFLAWAEIWADMAAKGQYSYSGKQEDWITPTKNFTGQEVAFMMTSSAEASVVAKQAAEAEFDFEVARMPVKKDAKYHGNFIGGATLWMTAGLEKKTSDGALAFMQYVNNPENAADWHKITGYVPVTKGAEKLLDKEGWFDENPHQRVAIEQLAATDGSPAATGPIVGNFVAIRKEMQQAMDDIMNKGDDPAERFAEAQKTCQKLLDEYNELNPE